MVNFTKEKRFKMDLNKLYDIAEKENIKVYDWNIEDCSGIYLNYDKINAVALNYDEFGTYIEEKCTLAEELGHYYMDATYSLSSSLETKSRQEYRAKKWAYTTLIPFADFKNALKKGITKIYELAEYFDVTVEFMQNCITFYTNKYGYITI